MRCSVLGRPGWAGVVLCRPRGRHRPGLRAATAVPPRLPHPAPAGHGIRPLHSAVTGHSRPGL